MTSLLLDQHTNTKQHRASSRCRQCGVRQHGMSQEVGRDGSCGTTAKQRPNHSQAGRGACCEPCACCRPHKLPISTTQLTCTAFAWAVLCTTTGTRVVVATTHVSRTCAQHHSHNTHAQHQAHYSRAQHHTMTTRKPQHHHPTPNSRACEAQQVASSLVQVWHSQVRAVAQQGAELLELGHTKVSQLAALQRAHTHRGSSAACRAAAAVAQAQGRTATATATRQDGTVHSQQRTA